MSSYPGGTHLDPVTECIVVKLSVAVSKERAGGRIIADGPVLVVEMAIIIHHDGITPGQPIGRAADKHVNRTAPIREETQKRDDPHSFAPVGGGVKSHGCITDTCIDSRWCRERGGA